MTQEERWVQRYNEVVTFIETNKRNPSRHDAEERGMYCNWMKHNKKGCLEEGSVLYESKDGGHRALGEDEIMNV